MKYQNKFRKIILCPLTCLCCFIKDQLTAFVCVCGGDLFLCPLFCSVNLHVCSLASTTLP